MNPPALSRYAVVAASRKRTLAAGGMRLQLLLQPNDAAMLHELLSTGYAPNASAAVRRALVEAHRHMTSPVLLQSITK